MINKLFLSICFAAILTMHSSSYAQEPVEFFSGNTISLVVGSSAGGGFDTYARMLAPYLAARIGAEVIVVNRPGGGGHVAINQLFDEKPDGLTIMLAHGTSAVLGILSGREGIRYDLPEFTYLGRVASHNRMWLVGSDSGSTVNTFIGNKDRVVFSSTGKIDGFSDSAAVICYALDLNCKITTGYKVTETILAIVRGEADAICMSDSSSSRYTVGSGGEMQAIAALGTERSGLYPDIPTLLEQVEIPTERQWPILVHQDIRKVGRMLIAPPGVPDDRVQFLRAAVENVLTSPEVITEGARIRRHINFADGEETQQLVNEILNEVSGDRLADFKKIFVDSYY